MGASDEGFKYPLVAWDKICSPIEVGGFGIRRIVCFNQVLLRKWLWQFGNEGPIYGDGLLPLSMGRKREDGVLMFSLWRGLMGVVYGIVFVLVGILFLPMWPLKLVWVIVFFFGMTSGQETLLLGFFTLNFMFDQLIRKLLSSIFWAIRWLGMVGVGI